METLIQPGWGPIRFLQALDPSLEPLMHLFSFLGSLGFYLALIPFIYWTLDRGIALRVLLALMLTDCVGTTAKLLLHEPRPYWLNGTGLGDASAIRIMATEPSYGAPSGHAGNSFAVWIHLAWRWRQRRMWTIAIALVVLIALSRLYLGVHFPRDILLGWLLGACMLYAFVAAEKPASAWAARQGASTLIGIGAALAAGVMALGLLTQARLADIPDPVAWKAHAANARSVAHFFSIAGILFGLVAGHALALSRCEFETHAAWSRRIARYAFGVIGLLIVYFGLGLVFAQLADRESIAGLLLRGLRFAAVGLWVTLFAPALFIRFGLAHKPGRRGDC